MSSHHNISENNKLIITLVSLKDWNTLETYIEEKCQFQCQRENSESSHSILHQACNHRDIPLSTVISIVNIYPNSIRGIDSNGRLPLHCAMRNGVGSDVVQYLLKEYPESAVRQDKKGKTPLHLACKYFAIAYDKSGTQFKYRQDRFAFMCEKLNMVMAMFLDADPDCFLIDDDKGMSALEYAIDGEVVFDTMYMMQNTIGKIQQMKTKDRSELMTTLQHDGLLVTEPGMNLICNAAA